MAINIYKPLKKQLISVGKVSYVAYAIRAEVREFNSGHLQRFQVNTYKNGNREFEVNYWNLFNGDSETLKRMGIKDYEEDFSHSITKIKKNIRNYFALKRPDFNYVNLKIYLLFHQCGESDTTDIFDESAEVDHYSFNGLVEINEDKTYTYTGEIQIDYTHKENANSGYVDYDYAPQKFSEPIKGKLHTLKKQYFKDLKKVVKLTNQGIKEEFKAELEQLDNEEMEVVKDSWEQWRLKEESEKNND